MTHRQRAKTAAHELVTQINAIRAERQQRDQHNPRLYLFGGSLGSYGIEAAFSTVKALAGQADKVLLVGLPGIHPLHKILADQRQPGSTSYSPVFTSKEVVFVTSRSNVSAIAPETRLAYLQNPTDPVTKWTPEYYLAGASMGARTNKGQPRPL